MKRKTYSMPYLGLAHDAPAPSPMNFGRTAVTESSCWCEGGSEQELDFDAIWSRYYETANRRFKEGLTYNELWFCVYGEKKEEE